MPGEVVSFNDKRAAYCLLEDEFEIIHPPTDEEITDESVVHCEDDYRNVYHAYKEGARWMRAKIFGVLLFLLLLTSCAAPNYLDSEIEQDKEVYLAGGGWECNDSTWQKIR